MIRILYLHGFASSPGSGKARFFASHFRERGAAIEIPALDEGDFEGLTLTRQLALIERLAAGGPVSLVGSSLGGYLAALYASSHAEVEKLVLLAPAFGFGLRFPETLGAERMARWKAEGAMEMHHYGEGRTRRLGHGLLEDAARHPDFPDFRQPALIFHGVHDDVVPVRYSEQYAAAHDNVRLEALDSGHDLHNVLDHMARRASDFLLGDAGR